jgi:hypothetical protein
MKFRVKNFLEKPKHLRLSEMLYQAAQFVKFVEGISLADLTVSTILQEKLMGV